MLHLPMWRGLCALSGETVLAKPLRADMGKWYKAPKLGEKTAKVIDFQSESCGKYLQVRVSINLGYVLIAFYLDRKKR